MAILSPTDDRPEPKPIENELKANEFKFYYDFAATKK
jgi:hypothetical protein